MSFFMPDRYFSRVSRIDISRDLLNEGLRFVLIDVDNTLRPWKTQYIPRDIGVWLGKARDAGVEFCLLTNNWHRSVYELAAELDMPIVAKACKPLPFAYMVAMRKLGATRKHTVMVGDQLVIDVVGAHAMGMKAYLIAPLVERDLPHTTLLRQVERLIVGEQTPEGEVSGAIDT